MAQNFLACDRERRRRGGTRPSGSGGSRARLVKVRENSPASGAGWVGDREDAGKPQAAEARCEAGASDRRGQEFRRLAPQDRREHHICNPCVHAKCREPRERDRARHRQLLRDSERLQREGGLSAAFRKVPADWHGASRTRTGDLLGAISGRTFAPGGPRSLKAPVCRDSLGRGRTRPIPSEPRALPLLPRAYASRRCCRRLTTRLCCARCGVTMPTRSASESYAPITGARVDRVAKARCQVHHQEDQALVS